MGTLDDFLASLKAAGCTELTLRFGSPVSEPPSAVPCSVAAVPPQAGDGAESSPAVQVGPLMPPSAEELAKLEAARERQRTEDMYAGSPARPGDVATLMEECDADFEAWRSEEAARALNPEGSVPLVGRRIVS